MAALFIGASPSVFAYLPHANTHSDSLSSIEHYETRQKIIQEMSLSTNDMHAIEALYRQDDGAPLAEVRVIDKPESLYIVIIPTDGETPTYINSPGSYILRHDRLHRKINQLKIYIHNSPDIFMRIVPHMDTSRLSLYFEDRLMQSNISLPPISDIFAMPLARLVHLTAPFIPWDALLAPHTRAASSVEHLVHTIRPHLSRLPDADDGAMNELGQLVYIDSGAVRPVGGGFNCSGFSKWIIDGFYYPLTGRYLSPAALSARQSDRRGHSWSDPYETTHDPYFGIDWSRALAMHLYVARHPYIDEHEAIYYTDVREVAYHDYIEDIGFPVAHLYHILYLLAHRDNESIYIGSVNGFRDGAQSHIRLHFHLALFFPYFDSAGSFKIVVMERNAESDIEDFVSRNSMHDIHLVRVPINSDFIAPQIAAHDQ